MEFQRVKGMEDYYPADFATYFAIASALREQAKKFGFEEVQSPAVEMMKTLTAKSGDEIKGQLFCFEQKSNEDLGLRFDLTVPMTRMFVTKQRELQKPAKWFSIAPMWRYEAPQKGRAREFYQLSVELFGSNRPEADATCMNLLISCMQKFGLTSEDITIKINNRKLLEGLLLEVAPKEKIPALIHLIDKVKKMKIIEFEQELKKLGIDGPKMDVVKKIINIQGDASIINSIKALKPKGEAEQGLKELEETLALVDKSYITIDLSIARGLAYYTGNVYECFDRKGEYRSLAGGGRYDELVSLFGGESTPATGFAIGFATLTLLLTDKNKLPKTERGPDYYIAPVNENLLPKAMELAAQLRGKKSVDIDLMGRKLAKQLDYASSIGAKKVIILGDKDLAEGNVTVRDMVSGKEEKISLKKLS